MIAAALLGAAFLPPTANGIAVFMLFGAGLVAGLLGQIGEGSTLRRSSASQTGLVGVPFEGLYQDALYRITADSTGLTRIALTLGPFGRRPAGGEPALSVAAALLRARALEPRSSRSGARPLGAAMLGGRSGVC